MQDKYHISTLEDQMRNELEENKDNLLARYDDSEDLIHELADGNVPVSTYDILQYGANNIELATSEPDIGPAFDGKPTPVNIIAANIYEHLLNLGREWLEEEHDRAKKLPLCS